MLAGAACLSVHVDAIPQQPVTDRQPISVARIREALKKPSRLGLTFYDRQRAIPVATFRTVVEEKPFMLPFMEQFHKEFELTDFQRQSQDWA